jgi:hypothetical protein
LGPKKERRTFQGKKETLKAKDEIDNNKNLENDISEDFSISISLNKNKTAKMAGSCGFNTSSHPIPSSWILLYYQSTVDIFCESSLLENIQMR